MKTRMAMMMQIKEIHVALWFREMKKEL